MFHGNTQKSETDPTTVHYWQGDATGLPSPSPSSSLFVRFHYSDSKPNGLNLLENFFDRFRKIFKPYKMFSLRVYSSRFPVWHFNSLRTIIWILVNWIWQHSSVGIPLSSWVGHSASRPSPLLQLRCFTRSSGESQFQFFTLRHWEYLVLPLNFV